MILAALLYIIWIHTSISRVSDTNDKIDALLERSDSPRPPNERESKRGAPLLQKLPSYSHNTAARERQALVFMTVPKNYRCGADFLPLLRLIRSAE